MSTTLQAPATIRRTFTRDIEPTAPRKYNRHSLTEKTVRVTFGDIGSASMDVWIRLEHVWIRGWVAANSSEAGLQVCRLLAEKLGVNSIGASGYTGGEPDFSHAPFELEVRPGGTSQGRKETVEEAHARVLQALRKRTAIAA